jgi:DNA-directed RNA polymerase subunit beta'
MIGERKLVQNAVDALFDNGKRSLLMDRSGKRPLKSLSEMLRSKEGMLRRNLLGKRVDYSGRSVIVVGPRLKLRQCGLPVELSMNLFKPFVEGRLIRLGYAGNISDARKLIKFRHPAAYEALEHEMSERVVLLNRAPTLHRMGIQAFDPVLVSGKAILLHPLVCSAFNADFDGDQMGVHLPVSIEAQIEARVLMMSVSNILSPANGRIITAPSQDIVLGIYYMTKEKRGCRGEGMAFSDRNELERAYEAGAVELHARVQVRVGDERVETTPGRVLFSLLFPGSMDFSLFNKTVKKRDLAKLLDHCYDLYGKRAVVSLLDSVKDVGFRYATLSGISLCMDDMTIPKEKGKILSRADERVSDIREDFNRGVITGEERHNRIVDVWQKAGDEIARRMMESLGVAGKEGLTEEDKKELTEFNSVFMMADSGARGSADQIRQVAGMRGLMAKPTGEIVEIPIRSNLKEGLTYGEYLLACHGARKGRADGALKTANAGYFTRRLAFACHDVVVEAEDCGTMRGREVSALYDGDVELISLSNRIAGRVSAEVIVSSSGRALVARNEVISKEAATEIEREGLSKVRVRSPITCELRRGICAMCYGHDPSSRSLVEMGEAVGIIAAQSIGEPGTQLTLRTFHSGGSAVGGKSKGSVEAREAGSVRFRGIQSVRNGEGRLIVSGRNGKAVLNVGPVEKDLGKVPYGAVLRVEDGEEVGAGQTVAEWDPYSMVVISVTKGKVRYLDIVEGVTVKAEVDRWSGVTRKVVTSITNMRIPRIAVEGKEYFLPIHSVIAVEEGQEVYEGEVIARIPKKAERSADITGGLERVLQLLETRKIKEKALISDIEGVVRVLPPRGRLMTVRVEGEGVSRDYVFSIDRQLNVFSGERVYPGDVLVDGVFDARDVLSVLGEPAAASFLIDEVQKVYRGQGVELDDKHLEIVVSKMLGMVQVIDPGGSSFMSGEVVTKRRFFEENAKLEGRMASARTVLLGLTEVGAMSESWLCAASFQRTTSVLSVAALKRQVDPLQGMKENVVMGKLVPAGTGHRRYRNTSVTKG